MKYQLIAFAGVIVLYFMSTSWKIRWLAFKLDCAAHVFILWNILLTNSGWDRHERHKFKKDWHKSARLRYELAKRLRS